MYDAFGRGTLGTPSNVVAAYARVASPETTVLGRAGWNRVFHRCGKNCGKQGFFDISGLKTL
jgi:hypothetical protein